MNKFLTCAACELARKGVKTRLAPNHTCGIDPKKIKEAPSFREIGGETYYKVLYHSKIAESYINSSVCFLIKHNQYLNGQKVPPRTEIWFNDKEVILDSTAKPGGPGVEKWFWLKESRYKILAFS